MARRGGPLVETYPISTYQPEPPASVRAKRPMRESSERPGDSDAFGEWLGHIAAGRIKVR